MIFLSPDSDESLISSEVLYNLVGSCRDVAFLELAKFGVENVDFVASRFVVSKCVTKPEDWMTVVGVNFLATDVVSSD